MLGTLAVGFGVFFCIVFGLISIGLMDINPDKAVQHALYSGSFFIIVLIGRVLFKIGKRIKL
jgi:uncharacterized membrane protein